MAGYRDVRCTLDSRGARVEEKLPEGTAILCCDHCGTFGIRFAAASLARNAVEATFRTVRRDFAGGSAVGECHAESSHHNQEITVNGGQQLTVDFVYNAKSR